MTGHSIFPFPGKTVIKCLCSKVGGTTTILVCELLTEGGCAKSVQQF